MQVRFLDLLKSFGMTQSVEGPTHNRGHTLDLVVTRSPVDIRIGSENLSDHSFVFFQITVARPPLEYIDICTRKWKEFNHQKFRQDSLSSQLCGPAESQSDFTVDQLQEIYDSEFQALLDKHAPKRTTKRRYQPLTPWFDSDCAASRRKSRMLERCYRRTKTSTDRLAWTTQVRTMHVLYKQKQNLYWPGASFEGG